MNSPVVIGNATLYLGDCVEFMRGLPDGAFDLAIVDPPYAVGASDGSFGRGGAKAIANTSAAAAGYRREMKHYSNSDKVPDQEYFDHLFRVSKNQIIWGANYYPKFLRHSGWVIWDKIKTDGLLSEAELAFQSIDKVVKIFRFQWEGFKKGVGSFEPTLSKTIHPNQKPVRLYEWLLTTYAKPGQTILDTHLGSGSTAIATNELGFSLTGCELDPEYYTGAIQRVTDAQMQARMFA